MGEKNQPSPKKTHLFLLFSYISMVCLLWFAFHRGYLYLSVLSLLSYESPQEGENRTFIFTHLLGWTMSGKPRKET